MRSFEGRNLLRAAGIAACALAACVASIATAPTRAGAQIDEGEFALFQPQQQAPVGRAWCNADRTVEYWAYVVGEYAFPLQGNGGWRLDATRVSGTSYSSFAQFRAAVLALPQMAGKKILFQDHSVTEQTVVN
jgi:hypothetical protein